MQSEEDQSGGRAVTVDEDGRPLLSATTSTTTSAIQSRLNSPVRGRPAVAFDIPFAAEENTILKTRLRTATEALQKQQQQARLSERKLQLEKEKLAGDLRVQSLQYRSREVSAEPLAIGGKPTNYAALTKDLEVQL